MKKPNILVIDGQGGKIGSAMLDALKTSLAAGGIDAELTAVGTNSIATANMLKSSPDAAATGENPVVVNCRYADYITGPVGIAIAGQGRSTSQEYMRYFLNSSIIFI